MSMLSRLEIVGKPWIGVSISFAVLAIARLVVPPTGLYMVTVSAIPAG